MFAIYYNYFGEKWPRLMCRRLSYTLETNLLNDEDEMFKSFKSNLRNEIRKTESLRFKHGVNNVSIEEYIDFFNSFARTKGLPVENKKRLSSYKKENIFFTFRSTGRQVAGCPRLLD
jgi:hypothetical protein